MSEGEYGRLKEAMQRAINSSQEEKVVGAANPQILAKLLELEDRHDEQHRKMAEKLAAFKEQLHREHEPECMARQEKMKELWSLMFDEMNVPLDQRDDDYRLNKHTGLVTKLEVIAEDFEGFEGSEEHGG